MGSFVGRKRDGNTHSECGRVSTSRRVTGKTND
jgi:hypothetical protein